MIDFHRAQGRRKRLCQALKAELSESEDASAPLLLSVPAEERTIAQRRIEVRASGSASPLRDGNSAATV